MRLWQLWFAAALWIAAPGGAEPTDYRLVEGDVIDVSVAPQASFGRTVAVQPDGKISYPVAGQIQAAGLTLAQLTEKIREGLGRQLVNPQVTVSLKQASQRAGSRISLLGAVARPGVYDIKAGTTVAEALAQGGGPSAQADLSRVTITRADQSVVTVDLSETEKSGRLDQRVTVQAGDVVVVTEAVRATVLILGEVVKPGPYDLPRDGRVLDAISLAGGPTAKADVRRVTLARAAGGTPRTLDLQPLLQGTGVHDLALNVPLQPGDTILIAQSDQQIFVLGRVVRPDAYPLLPNERVLDAVVKAGGMGVGAEPAKTVLLRRDATGQLVSRPLNLKKLLDGSSSAENDLLQAGDVLVVPDAKLKTRQSPLQILYAVTPVAGLLRILGVGLGGRGR